MRHRTRMLALTCAALLLLPACGDEGVEEGATDNPEASETTEAPRNPGTVEDEVNDDEDG